MLYISIFLPGLIPNLLVAGFLISCFAFALIRKGAREEKKKQKGKVIKLDEYETFWTKEQATK